MSKHTSGKHVDRHAQIEKIEKSGRRRSYLIAILAILGAAVLVSKLYTLQILEGARYQQDFQNRIRRTVVTRAARGTIYDKEGKVLAETRSSYNITMNDLTEDSSEDNELLNSRILKIDRKSVV